MKNELGAGCQYPDLLPKMAQFELTLLDWAEENKGSREYVASPISAGRRSPSLRLCSLLC